MLEQLFTYVNTFICCNKFTWLLDAWAYTRGNYDVNIQIISAKQCVTIFAHVHKKSRCISFTVLWKWTTCPNSGFGEELESGRRIFLVLFGIQRSFVFISCQKEVLSYTEIQVELRCSKYLQYVSQKKKINLPSLWKQRFLLLTLNSLEAFLESKRFHF